MNTANKLRIAAASALAAFLLFNSATANAAPAKPTASAKSSEQSTQSIYVDVKWLKDNLQNIVVVDANGPDIYAKGHIPGAINIAWPMLSNMAPKQGEAGWGVVLGKDELGAKIASFGIDGSKTIVVYNDPKGLGEEGRVLWMLKIAGIKDVRMLNGGIPAWKKSGGELSTEATKLSPSNFKVATYDDSRIATTDYVKANLGKLKLIDTRSPEEFNGSTNHGENFKGEKVYGHIPGAVLLQYSDLYRPDGKIKSNAELTAIFDKIGVKKDDEIVTYCTVGIRSGFAAEILKMAGYSKVKNYNASFSEWAGLGNSYEK